MGNSINQLTREAPAFAVSMNTGFLAISNNIPAFFDALQSIKKQNIELAKSGQPVKSVFSQLGSSLLSVQTLLSVGVTLLTIYGGKLIEMAQDAFKTTEALDAMKKAQEDVNFAVHKGITDSQDEVTHLRNLEGVINDNTVSMHKRLGAVVDLRALMPDHLKGYSDEAILAGNASIAIDKLAQSLTNAAIARALEDRISQQAVKDYDARRKLIGDINASLKTGGTVSGSGLFGSSSSALGATKNETRDLKRVREEGLRALKAFDEGVAEAAKARTKEFNKFFTPSADITGSSEDKKEKAPKKLQDVADTTFELEKQRLERIISVNNDIVSNQEETDAKRLNSVEASENAQIELVTKSKEEQLKQLKFTFDKEFSEGNKTIDGLRQLRLNYETDKIKITEDSANKIVDIEKDSAKKIAKIREFDTKEYEDELKRGLDQVTISNENAIQAEQERFNALKALGFANDKEKEKAAEDHERKLFEIKKAGLIAQTKLQINALTDELNAYEAQSDGSQKSQDFILNKRAEVAKLSRQLTETEGSAFNENEKKKAKTAKEQIDEILNISSEALGNLSDLSNAFSEGRIQNIEREIEKNNEYFDKQLELYEGDDQAQKTIEKERKLRNDELQKKIVKEKEKQAKFDKAVAIAQIGIQTALSIVKASPVVPLMVLAAAAGAIALATAIATPIPKFKKGTQNAPKGLAYVGDGGVSEVVTNSKGLNPVLTPATDTLVNLNKGDKVFPNIGAYQDYLRNQQIRQMGGFGAVKSDDRMLNEMKQTRKSIERLKLSVNVKNQKIDLGHQYWAQNNRKWN